MLLIIELMLCALRPSLSVRLRLCLPHGGVRRGGGLWGHVPSVVNLTIYLNLKTMITYNVWSLEEQGAEGCAYGSAEDGGEEVAPVP